MAHAETPSVAARISCEVRDAAGSGSAWFERAAVAVATGGTMAAVFLLLILAVVKIARG